MTDEIEIIDVDPEEIIIKDDDSVLEFKLQNDFVNRETMLNEANESLNIYKKKMDEYKELEDRYNKLKQDYETLEHIYQNEALINDEEKIAKKKYDAEMFELKKSAMLYQKKFIAIRSIVQMLINKYGTAEVVNITGISYVKLKEYLEK